MVDQSLWIMNREIIFRGKRIDNGEWMYGSLITGVFIKSATGLDIPYIFNTDECSNADCFEDFTDDYGYYEVDPATVSQFTGLTDKNGVKIFEGDILIVPGGAWGVVVWKSPFFEVTISETESSLYSREWLQDCEVCGNIHDNPELIGK